MICFKCGQQLPDDSVFCSACGVRVDGKKVCPSCKNAVEKSVIFCNHCGTRLDGNTRCQNCGEIFEGNFCPKCVTIADVIPQQKTREGGAITYKKIENYLVPAILLGALIVLFVCSFFMGVKASTSILSDLNIKTEFKSIFFFSDAYDEIKAPIDTAVNAGISGTSLEAYKFSLYLPTIVCTVVIALTMLTTFAMVVVGTVKLCVCAYKRTYADLSKIASIAFSTFFGAALIILSFECMSMSIPVADLGTTSSVDVKIIMSTGSTVGLILSGSLLFAALVLRQIGKGKQFVSPDNLKKVITALSTVVVLIVSAYLATKFFVKLEEPEVNSTITITTSANMFFQMAYALVISEYHVGESSFISSATLNNLLVPATIAFFISLVLTIVSCVLLVFLLSGLLSDKTYRKANFICGIITFIISIANVALSVVCKTAYSKIATQVGEVTSEITNININSYISFLITVLVIAGAITYFVLTKEKKAEISLVSDTETAEITESN